VPVAKSSWEGSLIRRPGDGTADGEKVYLVRNGKKCWVVSAEWLGSHGYRFPEDVKVVSAKELAGIPPGEPLQ
jgi:hypothetical protein